MKQSPRVAPNRPTTASRARTKRGDASADGVDVARRLLALLASEALRDGDRIPSERALSVSLGAPRSIVREALGSLALIGLLESSPGRGTHIRAADSEWVSKAIEWGLVLGVRNTMDLVEARSHLEITSARLAAERRDPSDVATLREIVEAMRVSEPDRPELVRLDVAFHLRLARASKNEVLARLLDSVETLLEVWIARVLRHVRAQDLHTEMYVEHGAILDAVADASVERAGALMTEAMERGEQQLREALQAARTYDLAASRRGLLVTQASRPGGAPRAKPRGTPSAIAGTSR